MYGKESRRKGAKVKEQKGKERRQHIMRGEAPFGFVFDFDFDFDFDSHIIWDIRIIVHTLEEL